MSNSERVIVKKAILDDGTFHEMKNESPLTVRNICMFGFSIMVLICELASMAGWCRGDAMFYGI